MLDQVWGTTKKDIKADFKRARSYMRMFEYWVNVEERITKGETNHMTLEQLFSQADGITGIAEELVRIANYADAYVKGRQMTLDKNDIEEISNQYNELAESK